MRHPRHSFVQLSVYKEAQLHDTHAEQQVDQYVFDQLGSGHGEQTIPIRSGKDDKDGHIRNNKRKSNQQQALESALFDKACFFLNFHTIHFRRGTILGY
ncbi:hypothetical protein MH928_09385 [Flavobacterium sp. WW92]|uniref:hypothetical protein n=1 Tax=unclassified Flavobacterium TaxID=196869 RepID=UPI0022241E05|nr:MULTISPECIES: hypothetical protein [unclassified Flavobacterium]WDO11544.1 hypothetical protein MH928_09385 [Flavobacterium sp. WW92]